MYLIGRQRSKCGTGETKGAVVLHMLHTLNTIEVLRMAGTSGELSMRCWETMTYLWVLTALALL